MPNVSKLNLPKGLAFLSDLPRTKMLEEMFKLYGVTETPGERDNPTILNWAETLGIKDYKHDSTAWCGLVMAFVAKQAGKPDLENPLWALNWRSWGKQSLIPKWGDILVFRRPLPEGGIAGHVGLYLAESEKFFYVLGGNTSDKVGIAKIDKTRLAAARNSYNVVPDFVKTISVLDKDVNLKLSTNEA